MTRKINISIPTYNRPQMTVESFIDVLMDERIEQVTIVDDASEPVNYMELERICEQLPKVKILRNDKNHDCYKNKYLSLLFSKSRWSVLLDSDNKISADYIDRLFEIPEWRNDTIYTPAFAAPHFDFTAYEGMTFSKENISSFVDKPMFEVMLNAANYFVNCAEYVAVWENGIDPVTSDSIFMCYNWLNSGRKIYVVPGLTYQHPVHDGSHYAININRTPKGFHQSILQKLRELR
jgi:glycosyltransferase involved in cell wall biosynthesis